MPLTHAFLCSLPPSDCLSLFTLSSACISHLAATHANHRDLLRTHGLVGLQQLPTAITLLSPPTAHGVPVWVCDPCRVLFATRPSAISHRSTAHAAITARTALEEGEAGTNRSIDAMARSMLTSAPSDGVHPAPARAPMPLRLIASAPYAPRRVLLFLTADTIPGLIAQLAAAWGTEVLPVPRWREMLARGVSVTIEMHDGRCGEWVLVDDRAVRELKARMAFGVLRIGEGDGA